MEIDTARAQRLQAFIGTATPEPNTRQFIELDGDRKPYSVYRVPLNYLIFNIRNGRFAAELLSKEKVLGRRLDSTKDEDAKVIRKLLIDQNESETEALRADLIRNGQVDPGIVTFDGAVINANRRFAIFSELYDKSHDTKHQYLLVSVLPRNVSEKDLWRIEAGLQFAKDFRLEYGPINELLKLREGVERGLTAKEISKSLLGRYTDQGVKERLEILKHIETFLQLTDRKGDYFYVQQQRSMEKFNSLQSNVVAPLKRKKRDVKDILAITNFGYALIDKTARSHWDIRKLSRIVEEAEAFKALKKSGIQLSNPLSNNAEQLDEAFQAAADIVEDREEKDKPERLLKRALSAVESIDRRNTRLKSPEVKKLIAALQTAVDALLTQVKELPRGGSTRKN